MGEEGWAGHETRLLPQRGGGGMGWARDPPSVWGRRYGLGTSSSLSVGEEGWAGHEFLPQRGGGAMGWARDPPSAWGRSDGLGTRSSLSVGEE